MDAKTRSALEAAGWKFGDAADLVGVDIPTAIFAVSVEVMKLRETVEKLVREKQTLPLLLREGEVCRLLSVSRATLYRRVGEGVIPKPLKRMGGSHWRRKDIERCVERMK